MTLSQIGPRRICSILNLTGHSALCVSSGWNSWRGEKSKQVSVLVQKTSQGRLRLPIWMGEGKSDHRSSWNQKKSTWDLTALNSLEPRKDEELQSLWIHLLIKFWCNNLLFKNYLSFTGRPSIPFELPFWDRYSFWRRSQRQLCRVGDRWDKKSWLHAVLKSPVAKAQLPWHWQGISPGWFRP